MFWKKARAKYRDITGNDPDISTYLDSVDRVQGDGYGGIVGHVQDIGHKWIAQNTKQRPVLEIGFGLGRHAQFYSGTKNEYYVTEFNARHIATEEWQNHLGRAVQCDARNLPFRDGSFSTVISIYNLEHIQEIQEVFKEVHRVLKTSGEFLIALPCEGGFLWNLGRELTTRRSFEKQYGMNYSKIIAYEHVWDCKGVIEELRGASIFKVERIRYLPFYIPSHHINLIACLKCTAR